MFLRQNLEALLKANWEVDIAQWRALVRAGLRHDLRRSRFLSGTGRKTTRPIVALLIVGLFSLLLGVGFAGFAVSAHSLLLASMISCSGVMFIAASLILVEYYAIILAPDDFPVLGHLPVASRTYFTAKLANLLIYILGFSSLSALPAAIGFAIRQPFSFSRGVVAFTCLILAAFTAAMAMVVLYSLLARLIPQRPLKYIVSSVQVVASFLIYGGYALLPRLMPEGWFDLEWQPGTWYLLAPPAWFAGLMQTVLGELNAWNLTSAILGMAISVGATFYGLSRLAKNYLAAIAGQTEVNLEATAEKRKSPVRRGAAGLAAWFRQPEERIIATLMSGQFRNDTKFRMAILTIIPLIAMYMFIAVHNHALNDPFIDSRVSIADNGLIYMAILLIPLLVKQSMEISDSFEAAWVFFASPMALHRLVLAAKRVSYVYFVMPTVLVVTALFAYFFGNILHALLHGLTLAFFAYFVQQFIFILNPRLPFSEPRTRGRQGTWMGLAFVIAPILGIAALVLIGKKIYAFPERLPIFYVAMVVVSVALDWVLQWRVHKKFSHAAQVSSPHS